MTVAPQRPFNGCELSSCQHLQKVPRQHLTDDSRLDAGLPRPFQENTRLPVKVPA